MNENLLPILKEALEKHREVEFAYLFGSQAQGKAGPLSDIDVAVYVDVGALTTDYPYGYKAAFMADLMLALKSNRVDVVILNDAKPFLRFQVIRHGHLILSRHEGKRVAFQVRTFNEYQDVKRLMEVQRQYLSERLEDNTFGQRR